MKHTEIITSTAIYFSALAHPYLIFSNKQDIRIYEVPNDTDYDLSSAKPRTTIAVKVGINIKHFVIYES